MSKKFFSTQTTTNTVSSSREAKDRAFLSVVAQSGKPELDFEANLTFDVSEEIKSLIARNTTPSGFIKGQRKLSGVTDFDFPLPSDLNFVPDAFWLTKLEAMVAGFPITVEYTGTNTAGVNLVQLSAAPVLGGSPPDVRRTDFVFLEVWPALVGPSLKAASNILIADNSALIATDTITIGGIVLTAVVGAPAIDQFTIGANDVATAANIVTAINDPLNSFSSTIFAFTIGTAYVYLTSVVAGASGNAITLAISNAIAMTIPGGFFTGGLDRGNKPSPSTIYRHGNTQSSTTVAFTDDLIDPTLNIETAQRVQIQYRIRTTGQTEAVNFKTDPDGFSNVAILARGGTGAPVASYPFVPANGTSITGSSSAVAYGVSDPGLWIAGDGSETASTNLQSLTGFVYAIPIAFIFRRNNAYLAGAGPGFSPTTGANSGISYNHPGFSNPVIGIIPAAESDRPDGLYYDAIDAVDLLDIRKHVCLSGHDFSSELDFQTKLLLDGRNKTWAIDISDWRELGSNSGCISTSPIVCNEIGRDSAHGGNNSTSGDTPRGVTVRNFDHVARRFASHSIVERAFFSFYPQDRVSGPVTAPGLVNAGKYVVKSPSSIGNLGWFEGDELHLDLSVLNATTNGLFNLPGTFTGSVFDFAPTGTVITDVLNIWHDDGDYNSYVDQSVVIDKVVGVGSPKVIVTIAANPNSVTGGIVGPSYPLVDDTADTGSPRRVFLEVEITYPKGIGLSNTVNSVLEPVSTVYSAGPMLENAISQRPSDMETPLSPSFREGYREVCLEYVASSNGMGAPIVDSFVSAGPNLVRFNRRIYGSPSHLVNVTDAVTLAPVTVNNATTEFGSSGCYLNLSSPLSGFGQTRVDVTYYAQDAIPNYGSAGGGYQLSVYYRSLAPQTVGSKSGVLYTPGGNMPTALTVVPLAVGDKSWVTQISAGSAEKSYPYENPSEAIALNKGALPNVFEWYFSGYSNITVSDFDANTGSITLPHFVPVDSSDEITFGSNITVPVLDDEFRTYYTGVPATNYRPTSMSQPLAFPSRHKTTYTMLGKITGTNNKLFREGEIVLIAVSQFHELSVSNTVAFVDSNNTTSASIFRTQNRLLVTK